MSLADNIAASRVRAFAARSSARDAAAAKQLTSAGYRVIDGTRMTVWLWSPQGARIAFATPRVEDGRWTIRRKGSGLVGMLLALDSEGVVADTPCLGFLQLLAMTEEHAKQ